jgi:hypothetical protein
VGDEGKAKKFNLQLPGLFKDPSSRVFRYIIYRLSISFISFLKLLSIFLPSAHHNHRRDEMRMNAV